MYKHIIPFLALTTATFIPSQAQELTHKIPAHSQFVLTFNNKAIVQQSSMGLLTETLARLGAFQDSTTATHFPTMISLLENDLNIDKQSYIYRVSTDSLYYVGTVLPLKDTHKVGDKLFSKFRTLPALNGYDRRISEDGKIYASWNHESLLLFTGGVQNTFFLQEEVAERYGLELLSYASEVDDTYYEAEAVEAEATATAAATLDSDEWITLEPEDGIADSLAQDSIYRAYQLREAKNDSIKNQLFVQWIAADMPQYLAPSDNFGNNKTIQLTNSNHLLRFWMPNVEELYLHALSYDILSRSFGVKTNDFTFGYKEATVDVLMEKNKLKILGTVQADEKLFKIFSSLYKNKMNTKFKKYIPEKILAYASANISTEAYLTKLPELMTYWYAPLAGEYAEVVNIGATALQIALDEKAIAKVSKGDNIFFLNDLKKVKKSYIDYVYDEDYNYEEVTKTKDEYVPSFLWVSTSEDPRIFKKILDFAVAKEKARLENDIYIATKTDIVDQLYFYFKDGLAFVGTDLAQMESIRDNRFRSNTNAQIKKDIYSNTVNMVVHMNAIPTIIKDLQIPLETGFNETVASLANYGNLQFKSNLLSKNRFYGELSLELPKCENNGLQYILKQVIDNLEKKSH